MTDKKVSEQKAEIDIQIDAAQHRIAHLENQLRLIDIELEELFQIRQQYILLSEISDRLEQLTKLGGGCLFWGKGCDKQQAVEHGRRIYNMVINYDENVKEVQKRREIIKEDIQTVIAQITILNEEILVVQERAAERDNEFVIEREMTVHPYRPMVMPWTSQAEDEKRFRKILLITLIVTIVMGFLMPLWDLPVQTRAQLSEVPERFAKLVVKKEPPVPLKEPQKIENLEPKDKKDTKSSKDKPKAQDKKTKKARKIAETSGLLAFKDNFAELMDVSIDQKLGSNARLSNKGQKARAVTRSLVMAKLASASSGISTASLSRNTGDTSKSIGGVEFSRVESAIGSDFFAEERPLSDGPGPSRTDEEIQIVFDRYKSALYRIYNRELRKNPSLQGKLVLKLTIEPDGKVSACSLESSDMDAPALQQKIVERVKRFKFGPKEQVTAITILYPIDFLPAN